MDLFDTKSNNKCLYVKVNCSNMKCILYLKHFVHSCVNLKIYVSGYKSEGLGRKRNIYDDDY